MDNPKYLIICTGYNGAKYIKKCYKSLVNQTYGNFHCILIDDGSNDNSKEVLFDLNMDKRFEVHCYTDNKGAAYRRYYAIRNNTLDAENTVVCLLGMDDWLYPNALEIIKKHYDNGKWMTYGNWIGSDGYKLPKGFLDYSDEIHEKRSYRKEIYRSTGLNTFKKFLFDELTEEDFKVNGEWVKATTESNLMFSCLEMCGKDKIGIVYDFIVNYTKRNDNTRSRMGSKYQDAIYLNVINRVPKKLLIR